MAILKYYDNFGYVEPRTQPWNADPAFGGYNLYDTARDGGWSLAIQRFVAPEDGYITKNTIFLTN